MLDSKKDLTTPGPPCVPHELLSSGLFLLARLGYAAKVETMDAFERAGADPYAYAVLALLAEGARETQAGIADALGLNRSLLVGVLDRMEERGLVERRRDPNDRRRQMVTATADGARRLAELRELAAQLESAALEPLDDDDRATLHRLLLRMAEHRDARYVSSRPS
jgi:DNA-binding MarR family transcriptional regulator